MVRLIPPNELRIGLISSPSGDTRVNLLIDDVMISGSRAGYRNGSSVRLYCPDFPQQERRDNSRRLDAVDER